ncbi:MAG TPA: XdhC/CoxI family protein [Candidatus Dormibacteraeota bacterium]|nr:XdhC/CoxI family protein [Candidatus Dormibacteraeota bacterium]
MKDILDQVETWLAAGQRVALATVIATERSAPHDPGATMAVSERGEAVGSVSGGCVEGAVVEESLEVIERGQPKRLSYGIADELALTVGLTCGGTIHVFVEPLSWRPLFQRLADAIRAERPAALVTEIEGPQPGTRLLVGPDWAEGELAQPLGDRVVAEARALLAAGLTARRAYGRQGEARRQEVEVFVRSFAPPARMYVFGATDFARAAARMGKFLGYRVTVCDARSTFVTRARFPEADELVVRWPDEFLAEAPVDGRTVICILTHDPKFDVPLLQAALRTPAAYIGAMGSRRTDVDRTRRLRELGLSESELARIRGPIGLDLGARTPEEVAVAIAGEIIALRHRRPGGFLRDRSGPVHGLRPEPEEAETAAVAAGPPS